MDNCNHKSININEGKKGFFRTWELLKSLNLEKQVIETWLNEPFTSGKIGGEHGGGCCGASTENPQSGDIGHCHDHDHDHGHHHHHNQDEGRQQTASSLPPGIAKKDSRWATFNPSLFWQQGSEEEKSSMNAAIDYFLFYQYPKTLAYQTYGLNDYYQQLRKQDS